jgi:hypothetical protein
MVFKFFSKPKAEIDIKADSKGLPGASLPLEIRLSAQEEIKAREVRVELVGEEKYYVRETHRDSKGHTQTRIVQRTNAIAKINKTLVEQPTFMEGAEQRWSLSMQIPSDAPPTCCGKLVNIQWKLKATLDVPKQPDQSQEIPLRVLRQSPQTSNVNVFPTDKVFDSIGVNLEVAPVVSPGEILIGRLTLQVKDNLNAQGIRVELVQVEDAGARNSNEVIAKADVSGSTSFNQYESPSFEFSLKIPADAPPTACAPHSSLGWKVKAVIARRMKTDFNVEREVIVYNTQEEKDK